MLSINELQNYSRSSGSSMISLLIPPETNIHKLRSRMVSEIGSSQNIKDKNNRMSVNTSLSKILDHLKAIDNTSDKGLALYAEQNI